MNDTNNDTTLSCRAIAGQTPVVAPLDWWGRCEKNYNYDTTVDTSDLPRDYSSSTQPFTDIYCVADNENGSTGSYSYDYFDGEIYVGNDRGGEFTIEGKSGFALACVPRFGTGPAIKLYVL